MYAPQIGPDLSHGGLYGVSVGNVAPVDLRADAQGTAAFRNGLRLFRIPGVNEGQICAQGGQFFGDGGSDPPGGPGDDGHFSL